MLTLLLSAFIAATPPSLAPLGATGHWNQDAKIVQDQRATPQELAQAKKEGVTNEELPEWLKLRRVPANQRPKPFDHRQLLLSRQQLERARTLNTKVPIPLCEYGGLEGGDFTGWTVADGTFTGPNTLNFTVVTPPAPTAANQLASRHTVLPASAWASFTAKPSYTAASGPPNWNGPFDPVVSYAGASGGASQDIPLPFPGGQARTYRLGNPTNGSGAEMAWMPFTVPPAMTDFAFQYAMVMEDPGHQLSHQPRFIFQLWDITANQMVTSFERVATSSDPFFKSGAGPGGSTVVWRRVSCFKIPVGNRVGHQLVAVFVNTDCGHGGHFGYTYLDSLCDQNLGKPVLTAPAKICIGEPLKVDGSQSVGVLNYTWTLVPCDANGNNEVLSAQVQKNGTGPITGLLDLAGLATQMGKPLKCGNYYKVKLNVDTECAAGETVSKVVFVDCCDEVKDECCKEIRLGKEIGLRPTNQRGWYGFSLPVAGLPANVTSVDFNVISSSQTYVGPDCPPNGPVYGYVSSASNLGQNFGAPIFPANPYSHCVRWTSPGTTSPGSLTLPVVLTFPPAMAKGCTNYLRFCIRVTVKTKDCRSCELTQWFYFKRTVNEDGRETITQIPLSQWPNDVPKDGGVR